MKTENRKSENLKNYILLKHLDQESIKKLNAETESTKQLNNNILIKAIEAGAIIKDKKPLESCYTSSSYISGLYYPNNIINTVLNGSKFVCVVAGGFVVSFSGNYFLMVVKKVNLKNTLIMEGRGSNTGRQDLYNNYRHVAIITPGKKTKFFDRIDKQHHFIKNISFEFGGGRAFGYYVNGGRYKRRETENATPICYFKTCAELETGAGWSYDPKNWENYKNIFETYNNYINGLQLDHITAKNGKKWTEENKNQYNNFIVYNENNILKIINFLTKRNFKKIISNYSVYDIETKERIYN